MNPLEQWKRFFSPEETYIPVDPDELEEICCDAEQRVISHIGIEMLNCVFNCFELQEIRRQLPSLKNPYVKVKFHRDSLRCIWVVDPRSGDRIRVLNVDPVTAELSAFEMAETIKLQSKQKKTTGEILAFSEALRRMREIGQSLLRANTQGQRRRGFKMLGLVIDEKLTPADPPPARRTQRKSKPASPGTKQPRSPLPLAERVDKPITAPKTDARPEDLACVAKTLLTVPIFGVVKRPADPSLGGGSDANSR